MGERFREVFFSVWRIGADKPQKGYGVYDMKKKVLHMDRSPLKELDVNGVYPDARRPGAYKGRSYLFREFNGRTVEQDYNVWFSFIDEK